MHRQHRNSLDILFVSLYLCLISSVWFDPLSNTGIMSQQQTPTSNQITPQIQTFMDSLKHSEYLKISPISRDIILKHVVECQVSQVQQIIDDIALYSDFMISNLKGSSVNNTATNQSKIFAQMVRMNSQDAIIEIMVYCECYPFRNTQFYIIFLLFSRNTFATFTMTQRITCYRYIDEQFDEIEDIIDDIDEYDENDNNSAIVEEMKLSISASNEFVSEFQRAIKQSHDQQSPFMLHMDHKNDNDLTSEGFDWNGEHKEHVFNLKQCNDIVSEMIQIETGLDILYFDDNAQNISNLIYKISCDVFLDLHGILTRHIMNEYIKNIETEWSAIISKQMCLFIIETYFMNDKSVQYQNINVGNLMRRHLPHSPLLHVLINTDSNIGHKLNAKEANLKLIQYIQLVSLINGIPSMMNILNKQEGSNIIHFDLLFVFHKKIWKEIADRIVKNNSHNFLVKNKKIKKQQQYYDPQAIKNHIFTHLLQILCKLVQNAAFTTNVIRIFVNCSKHVRNKYPELIIEYRNKSVICKYKLNLFYAVLSRKRYTSDVENAKQALGYKFGGHGNADIAKIVESGYFMHSFIIKPRDNSFNVLQFIHYGFGVIRFVKEDIYRIMPHFFVNTSKYQYLTQQQVLGYDKQVSYLIDELYIETEQKFDKFRQSSRKHKHLKYSTKK